VKPALEPQPEPSFEAHFESLDRQREAARLGMWIFLASELLLFGALFALYATERAEHPAGFHEGMKHAEVITGSVNTVVLLISSYLVARAVHALRDDRARFAAALTGGTVLLGLVFLGLKFYEYGAHIEEGAVPGGHGAFYLEHRVEGGADGLASYFTLYWLTTGLHAVHVLIGMSILAFFGVAMWRRRLGAGHSHRLEIAALYWHLVDAVWIFLWPLYYLMR
jgi:cytochrome c oxidase subunit 3